MNVQDGCVHRIRLQRSSPALQRKLLLHRHLKAGCEEDALTFVGCGGGAVLTPVVAAVIESVAHALRVVRARLGENGAAVFLQHTNQREGH